MPAVKRSRKLNAAALQVSVLCTCCRARQTRQSRTLRSRSRLHRRTGLILAIFLAKTCRCLCTARPLQPGAADPRLSASKVVWPATQVAHCAAYLQPQTSSQTFGDNSGLILHTGLPVTQHGCPRRRVARALKAQHSQCHAQQGIAPATPQASGAAEAARAATRASRPLSASNTARRHAAEDAAAGKENGHATALPPPETETPVPKPAVHPHSQVRALGGAHLLCLSRHGLSPILAAFPGAQSCRPLALTGASAEADLHAAGCSSACSAECDVKGRFELVRTTSAACYIGLCCRQNTLQQGF